MAAITTEADIALAADQAEAKYFKDYCEKWHEEAEAPGCIELPQPPLALPLMHKLPLSHPPLLPDFTETYINGPLSVEDSTWSTKPRTGGPPFVTEKGLGILVGFYMTPKIGWPGNLSSDPDEWRCVYGKVTKHRPRARAATKRNNRKPAAKPRYTIVFRVSKYTFEHVVSELQGEAYADGAVLTNQHDIVPLKRCEGIPGWMLPHAELGAVLHALTVQYNKHKVEYRERNRKHINIVRMHGPNFGTLRPISIL